MTPDSKLDQGSREGVERVEYLQKESNHPDVIVKAETVGGKLPLYGGAPRSPLRLLSFGTYKSHIILEV